MTEPTPIRLPAPTRNLRFIRDPRITIDAIVATFAFRPTAEQLEDFLNHLVCDRSVSEAVAAMGQTPDFGDKMVIYLASQVREPLQ